MLALNEGLRWRNLSTLRDLLVPFVEVLVVVHGSNPVVLALELIHMLRRQSGSSLSVADLSTACSTVQNFDRSISE